MYFGGKGVPQDDEEGLKWSRKAAMQGFVPAQLYVAMLHHQGNGVPKDEVEAYAWLAVAAVQNEEAMEYRNAVAASLSPEQLAQGQRRSTELFEKISAATPVNKGDAAL